MSHTASPPPDRGSSDAETEHAAERAAAEHAAGQAARHDPVYDRLHETAEFEELRRRYRGFVFPATVAFLVWYLLYVVLSNWGGGLMDARIVGHINVALVFGLLQFATTFAIAFVYARFSRKRLDPLARNLEQEYVKGVRR